MHLCVSIIQCSPLFSCGTYFSCINRFSKTRQRLVEERGYLLNLRLWLLPLGVYVYLCVCVFVCVCVYTCVFVSKINRSFQHTYFSVLADIITLHLTEDGVVVSLIRGEGGGGRGRWGRERGEGGGGREVKVGEGGR